MKFHSKTKRNKLMKWKWNIDSIPVLIKDKSNVKSIIVNLLYILYSIKYNY